MPRKCTVCNNPEIDSINILLVNGVSNRAISSQYGVDRGAVQRHKRNHLAELLSKVQEEKAEDLLFEVNKIWSNEQKLLAAIHEELADPLRPGKYSLNHKPEDIKILYVDDEGKPRRQKLSTLLKRLNRIGTIEEVQSRVNFVDEFHRAQLVLKNLIELKIEMAILKKLDKLEKFAEEFKEGQL